MKILAIDLGTKTGWAYGEVEYLTAVPELGTWDLATKKEIKEWGRNRMTRRCDPRIRRLHSELLKFPEKVDCVVFEDVQFASYTLQVQLWSSLRAVVWIVFGCYPGIVLECVPVGTLKQFATGCGGALKYHMANAAVQWCPSIFAFKKSTSDLTDLRTGARLDDNAIDALHLWRWATRSLTRVPR